MSTDKDKKEVVGQVPPTNTQSQEGEAVEQVPTTETQSQGGEAVSPPKYSALGTYGKDLEEKQKVEDAEKENLNQALTNMKTAQEQGQSAILALLNANKPERNVKKERNLRNRAIVQSLGDMLTSIAQGAIAYGKNGAGYVPKIDAKSPLASIEELNKMRLEYAERNKEWKDAMLEYEIGAEKDKIAAADKLATKAEEDLKAATKSREAAEAAYRDVEYKEAEAARKSQEAKDTAAQKFKDDIALEDKKHQNRLKEIEAEQKAKDNGSTDDESTVSSVQRASDVYQDVKDVWPDILGSSKKTGYNETEHRSYSYEAPNNWEDLDNERKISKAKEIIGTPQYQLYDELREEVGGNRNLKQAIFSLTPSQVGEVATMVMNGEKLADAVAKVLYLYQSPLS